MKSKTIYSIKGYRDNDDTLNCRFFTGEAATSKGAIRKINFLIKLGYSRIRIARNGYYSYICWVNNCWVVDDGKVSAKMLRSLDRFQYASY